MDRSDERKNTRSGDILGLGGISSGRGSDTLEPRGHATDEDQQRRRQRMREGADDVTSGETEGSRPHRGAGATGIDMGASGEGTDVE